MVALREAIANLTSVLVATEIDYRERLAALPPIESGIESVLLEYLASEDEQMAHKSATHNHMTCRKETGVACPACVRWTDICARHYAAQDKLLAVCRAIRAKKEAR